MQDVLNDWLSAGSGKKILLMRHGEVQGGKEKRFIGHTDVPLSDRGRHQAMWWRRRVGDGRLDSLISSDLARCRESAHIIAGERYAAVDQKRGLREINLGQWDGMSFRQVKSTWPDAFRARGEDIAGYRPPQGESFLDLRQRVIPLFEQMVAQAAKRLLIVAHAGVNRVILCHVLGMPIQNLFRLAQGHGAMNLIDFQDGGYRIQSLNLLPGSSETA